jgi:hypothetical protein
MANDMKCPNCQQHGIKACAVAPVVPIARLITGEQKSVTMLFAIGDNELPTNVFKQANTLMRDHGGTADAMSDNMIVALFGVPTLHEKAKEHLICAKEIFKELCTTRYLGWTLETMADIEKEGK